MIESLIVYLVTICLLFFVLSIFSILYQRWNIQTIANEASTRFAQTYAFPSTDYSTSEIKKSDIVSVPTYRFMDSSLDNKIAYNVSQYCKNRLSKTTFTKDVSTPKIITEIKNDAMARKHIVVTIDGKYRVPFGGILTFFGFDENIEYHVSSYSDCIDLIDYVNAVDFVNGLSSNPIGSKAIDAINSLLDLFDDIKNGK